MLPFPASNSLVSVQYTSKTPLSVSKNVSIFSYAFLKRLRPEIKNKLFCLRNNLTCSKTALRKIKTDIFLEMVFNVVASHFFCILMLLIRTYSEKEGASDFYPPYYKDIVGFYTNVDSSQESLCHWSLPG